MADIKKILTRVKDYVTQEDNLEKTRAENAEETLQNNIDALDLAQVGSAGNYIKYVSQEDGQVAAQKQAFDTVIDTNSNDTNAPTSKAVKDHVQAEINKLDVASQGGNGKYIRSILEEDGKISATPQDFDTDFNNPSNNNAPTTQAVKDLINSLDANQVGQDGHYIKTISEENGIITATKEAFETSIPSSNPSEILAPTVKAVKNYVDTEIDKLDANLGDAAHLVSTIKEVDGKLTEVTGPEILGTINTSANIPTSGAVKTYADAINTDLQTQIDNLKSVQNVAEVVADVTTLNQLDKSKYDENDKVQVIDDINHAHATTVYRLTNNTWDYVGSYGGDSYTKTQADERFVQKTFEINSHALSGNSISLDKTDIGLGNVDNTSDNNKPVSAVQQTALNGKVDKTTTINGYALNNNINLNKTDVGLGNVDNTSDANKPISTATQTALDLKENLANKTAVWVDDNNQSFVDDTHYPTTKLMYDTLETMNNNIEELIESATNILTIDVANVDVVEGYITAEEYNKINERTIIKFNYAGAPSALASHLCFHYSFQMLGLAKVFSCVGDDDFILFAVNISPETSGTYAGLYHWGKETSVSDLNHAVKDNQDNEFDHSHKNTFKGETEFQDIMTIKSEMDLTTDGYIKGGYISSSISAVSYRAATQLDDVADAIWNAKKAYAVGDIIFYSRALYICEVAVSASRAGNTVPSSDPTH